MFLDDYGWNEAFQQHFEALNQAHLQPARVSMQGKGHYRLLTAEGAVPGRLTGKLVASALAAGLPAVGTAYHQPPRVVPAGIRCFAD